MIGATGRRRNGADAADLKFLRQQPQDRASNFKSKSGTRKIKFVVPLVFSKFV
jgi:hypothetical protein